ncbi:PREDICTED: G-type lectin S-receptor-like serine/threonine-protein kinase At2g19130 [Camelina sativa]|uniref:Receptor-like serine/threonine-protein kinase n=1 Tax=Camelina sativa TaxID=90675 RepID=A0ABM0XQP7_CAMSA|nr:PREDICTED: G-type lectin S-receptor-like serine/threonine-protein kinase At2g19130 [Camelina sativa]
MVSFFLTLSSFFFLCFFIHGSSAVDTISGNFNLSGDQTIISSGGTFEMGFFKPGASSNFYIGMWYKQLSQTILWVANRDKPVSDKFSSILKISDGNLILLDGNNQTPVWSTGLNSTSSSVSPLEAVLLDNGNLVLRSGGNDSSANVLWESFDHPGNTWLPGVKIRLDKRTGKSQRLTSWKSSEDPSPGLFSLELDESNAYKILWNGTNEYWSSGPWNPQSRIFDWVPEMRLNYIYNFSFVSNSTESYFTYSIYNHMNVSRFVMDVSGQIKQFSWLDANKEWNLFWSQPRQQCQVYKYCGSFGICTEKAEPFCRCPQGFRPQSQKDWDLEDYSAGCVRNTALQCSPGDVNQFFPIRNMKVANHSKVLTQTSLSICASTCQRDCSCKAYAHDEGSNQCLIWAKDVFNLQQLEEDNSDQGNTFYLRLAPSDIPNGSSSKSNKAIIFGAVIGALGVVVLVLLVVILVLRYRRRKRMRGEKGDGTLAAFSYRELQNATKNFSDKLGGGGFGSVFKGALPDSSDVAVKRLESISQGEKQFRTEVVTIGTIQHVNLVRLRGFCSEGNKKLLVYDYMPNGSLDSHLFFNQQVEEKIVLGWKLRFQIALGTARGLAYLHDECRDCIIHCDIKPENILLDSQFCPKVADFGLAKLVGRDFSRVLTTMRGTRGYLAPEWISGVAITAKADVYSYGMMLFELVSGRRNTEQSENENVRFFPSWAATILTKDGDIRSLLDPRLEGHDVVDIEELTRACRVACWCIQDEESHRPSMSQVVQILEGVLEVNVPPFPRSIQALVDTDEAVVFFTESSSSSSHNSSQKHSHSSSSTSSKKTTNENSSA